MLEDYTTIVLKYQTDIRIGHEVITDSFFVSFSQIFRFVSFFSWNKSFIKFAEKKIEKKTNLIEALRFAIYFCKLVMKCP